MIVDFSTESGNIGGIFQNPFQKLASLLIPAPYLLRCISVII